MCLAFFKESGEGGDGDAPHPPSPSRAPTSSNFQIKLPSTVEDYSDDEDEEEEEDDQRPFTREELKLKSIRGIQKKQGCRWCGLS